VCVFIMGTVCCNTILLLVAEVPLLQDDASEADMVVQGRGGPPPMCNIVSVLKIRCGQLLGFVDVHARRGCGLTPDVAIGVLLQCCRQVAVTLTDFVLGGGL
jgi:hypothetical protein